jgi:repressor LexA
MEDKLTDRQKNILDFICQYRDENGYPPTLREIGKNFDIASTFGVKRHLDALEKKGYIAILTNMSRGITILKPELLKNSFNLSDNVNRVPIVGQVAAGSPVLAEENIEGSIAIDRSFLKRPDEAFALKVKGDSMINAGIFEGDMVIVSPVMEVKNGEIIVAMINGEVTVKNFEKKNNIIQLNPENERYQPIIVTEEDQFSVVGKVVGVFRWIN